MTLQEAKDQIANKHNFIDWRAFSIFLRGTDTFENVFNEAAELYARAKWDEACESTRLDDGYFIFSGAVINEDFYTRPKPEFKP